MSLHVGRARRAVLVLVLVAVSATVASVAVDATPPAAHAASGFTGLAPARLWDTRSGTGIVTVDGTNVGTGRLGPDASYRLRVAGRGGVPPTGATAVVANVTAIDPSEPSFLTVYPAGANRPNASNLNTDAGRTLPNAVIVPLSAAGEIDVYNAAGTTDVAVDVLGWFDGSGGFTGLTPARLWETRTGPGLATVDGLASGTGPLGANASFRLRVTGRGNVPATGVGAVALNVTAIAPTDASFVTVYPAGIARPNASNLNTAPGRTLPNMVIVPVPATGEIDIYNAVGSTDVAIDVLGWFPSGPAALQPLNPARLWDTRSGPGIGTTDGLQLGTGRLAGNGVFTVQVTGRGPVPATGVSAVALNVTAIAPDAGSFVTAYPAGQNRPTASNLNTAPGRTLPNMVIVPVSADGKVDVFNFAGTTDVAVDVLGWFPGAPGGGGGGGGAPVDAGLLYISSLIGLEVVDVGLLRDLVGPTAIDADTDFAVNQRGTEFTYAIDNVGPGQTVVVADLATGDIKTQFQLGGYMTGYNVLLPSADDTRYAAIVNGDDPLNDPDELRIVTRTGAFVAQLPDARAVAWAPDGGLVVLARSSLTTYAMTVIPKVGATYTLATFARAFDDLPKHITVSPDQSLVAFGDGGAIWTVPYAGGAAPRKLVESDVFLNEPAFSPDGNFLAFSRNGNGGAQSNCDAVYIVPVTTSGPPIYTTSSDDDPFKLILEPFSRVTSCGEGMFWR